MVKVMQIFFELLSICLPGNCHDYLYSQSKLSYFPICSSLLFVNCPASNLEFSSFATNYLILLFFQRIAEGLNMSKEKVQLFVSYSLLNNGNCLFHSHTTILLIAGSEYFGLLRRQGCIPLFEWSSWRDSSQCRFLFHFVIELQFHLYFYSPRNW